MTRSTRQTRQGFAPRWLGPRTASVLGGLLVSAALGACSAGSSGDSSAAEAACEVTGAKSGIEAYTAGQVLGKGPYGETSADAASIELSADQVAAAKKRKLTAAIVMHFSGDTWSNAQVSALRSEFDRLGVEVVAETSADAVVTKQFDDIESALASHPDIMVSIPSLDVQALAPAYRKVAAAGVKLVFMDNPAQGMKPGTDYVSVVASDYYGFGVINAHQMAEAICGKGEVGVLRHGAKAPNNVQSLEGFEKTIADDYPDIKIVEQSDILGPDFSGEGETNVSAMLTSHPKLEGVWCFFDVPCEGAISAARAQGRTSLALTMGGLGQNVAVQMAKSSDFVRGIGSVQPYRQGIIEARLGVLAALGEKTPPFVSLPAVPVDRDNLRESWEAIYDAKLPSSIETSLASSK